MSEKSFSDRHAEIVEQMNEEGMSVHNSYNGKGVYEEGLDSINMSRGRDGGRVFLPNERLAILWYHVFRVQFTDGGWRDTESNFQLEHPFSYSRAEIVVDTSRGYPRFESSNTHEKIDTPLNHFDVAPQFYEDMVYLVRLYTGDDSYGMTELKEDLRTFDNMEFNVASIENCSRCNPNIY